jgi:lipopolysaccharide transport system ATP-binding protein
MNNIAIKAENLSKAYQLGEIGTGTISRDLERWVAKLRGKEDPFLRIGEANDRTSKGTSDIVWSLKDINFEIEQGDAVGIIGRNGAGKSTLLKVLSRVTSPTTGKISGKGRIASLLEVGTGFHPELTGRENIFLNGAILGMRKKEITKKFDEILDFAGVERYVDTPVKRYSSGMYVRLAFAVAAHLESEILIVDEVLAVGDAEFQKKCLGKMGEVSKGEGRTVLFVSHNMGSVSGLCNKGIVLKNGNLDFNGNINQAINHYLSIASKQSNSVYINKTLTDGFNIAQIKFNSANKNASTFSHNEDVILQFDFNHYNNKPQGTTITVLVEDELNKPIFATHYKLGKLKENNHSQMINMVIPKNTLLPGRYLFSIIVHVPNVEMIAEINNKLELTIEDTGHIHSAFPNRDFGRVTLPINWL